MDDFAYIALTGAVEAQTRQSVTSNNLANASTIGFKATLAGAVDVEITGPGFDQASVYAVTEAQGTDLTQGAIIETGRDLDIAVNGDGWLVVQGQDGLEAYTRAGALRVDSLGQLLTSDGRPVLGDGGPIALPAFEKIEIASDGRVNVRELGQDANALTEVDRIRLVNPPPVDLRRGEDGLMRLADGTAAPPDASVTLTSGALESSNVNLVGAMVEMIEQSRAFEMHVKMLSTAEEIDQASLDLIRLA